MAALTLASELASGETEPKDTFFELLVMVNDIIHSIKERVPMQRFNITKIFGSPISGSLAMGYAM